MRSNIRRKKKSSKKFEVNVKTTSIIVVIVIIFILLLFSTMFALTNSVSEKIVSGVSINGFDVSKLTINEAYEKLKSKLEEGTSKNLVVKQGDYETTISLQQLEAQYDVIEAVNEAYKVGRNNNIIISNFEILKAMIFGESVEKYLELNDGELNKKIEDIASKIPDIVVQSSYYIEDNNLIISNGKSGNEVQKEQFKNDIINAIQRQLRGYEVSDIQVPVIHKEPDKIDVAKIREEIYQEPQNAHYEEEPFKLTKEENGIDFKISVEEANKIIEEEKEEYIIPLDIIEPEIKIADISNINILPDQISKYMTRYDESNVNRTTNIKLSSEKIDGTMLMPGETFSYNKIVGERTIKAGYKEASVYMNGKVVDGIGGGICQVSSTLYNAVLEANLEIVERKNHHFITAYVPASRDATVSYGTIDFKFKNTRAYPIKIQCTSQNGVCQVVIYGIEDDEEYEVEIEEKITEVIPYTTKYVETNTIEKGMEKVVQNGVNGYKSEAYRILKLNGQVISKTLLSKDSYNPLEKIIEKGTK